MWSSLTYHVSSNIKNSNKNSNNQNSNEGSRGPWARVQALLEQGLRMKSKAATRGASRIVGVLQQMAEKAKADLEVLKLEESKKEESQKKLLDSKTKDYAACQCWTFRMSMCLLHFIFSKRFCHGSNWIFVVFELTTFLGLSCEPTWFLIDYDMLSSIRRTTSTQVDQEASCITKQVVPRL